MIAMKADAFEVWRCPNCGRILAEVNIRDGAVRVKCGCNEFSTLQVVPSLPIVPAEQGASSQTIELNGL